jgi:hypothetical protein
VTVSTDVGNVFPRRLFKMIRRRNLMGDDDFLEFQKLVKSSKNEETENEIFKKRIWEAVKGVKNV